jgi:hypothetical protein
MVKLSPAMPTALPRSTSSVTTALTTLGRAFYERMWRHGHMFFSAVPVKARSNRC